MTALGAWLLGLRSAVDGEHGGIDGASDGTAVAMLGEAVGEFRNVGRVEREG